MGSPLPTALLLGGLHLWVRVRARTRGRLFKCSPQSSALPACQVTKSPRIRARQSLSNLKQKTNKQKSTSLQTSPSWQWSGLGRGCLRQVAPLPQLVGTAQSSALWGPYTHQMAQEESQGLEVPSIHRAQSPFSKESEFLGSNSQCGGLHYRVLWDWLDPPEATGHTDHPTAPFCVGEVGTGPSLRLQPQLPLRLRSHGPQSQTPTQFTVGQSRLGL